MTPASWCQELGFLDVLWEMAAVCNRNIDNMIQHIRKISNQYIMIILMELSNYSITVVVIVSIILKLLAFCHVLHFPLFAARLPKHHCPRGSWQNHSGWFAGLTGWNYFQQSGWRDTLHPRTQGQSLCCHHGTWNAWIGNPVTWWCKTNSSRCK